MMYDIIMDHCGVNRYSGLAMALNYRLFPVGSLKNIVYCSPFSP